MSNSSTIAKKQFKNLRSQIRDFEVKLNVDDTLWRHLITKQWCLCVLSCWYDRVTSRTRNIYYVIFLFILALVAMFSDKILIINFITGILVVIFLTIVILDVNYFIFLRSIKNFDVYYKVINITIAEICRKLLTQFGQNEYDIDRNLYTHESYHTLTLVHGIVAIVGSAFIVFALSIIDGYWVNLYLKRGAIITAILWYGYMSKLVFYNDYVVNNGTDNDTINLFGQKYKSLRSVALSSLSSLIIFLLRQLFYTIRKPTKLLLVPIHATFDHSQSEFPEAHIQSDMSHAHASELTLNSNLFEHQNGDHDGSVNIIHSTNNVSVQSFTQQHKFCIQVDKRQTLLYILLVRFWNMNVARANMISNAANSVCVWIFCFGYSLLLFVLVMFTNHRIIGWLQITLNLIQLLTVLVTVFNANILVFEYSLSSFSFWWKVQDVLILAVLEVVMDLKNKNAEFSLNNNSLTEAYIIATINFLIPFSVVWILSMTFGVFIKLHFKAMFLILAIIYWTKTALRIFFFDNEKDVTIDMFSSERFAIDCKSTILSKSFDIVVWLTVLLINQIRVGDGIIILGKVDKQWIKYKLGSQKQESDDTINVWDDNNYILLPDEQSLRFESTKLVKHSMVASAETVNEIL